MTDRPRISRTMRQPICACLNVPRTIRIIRTVRAFYRLPLLDKWLHVLALLYRAGRWFNHGIDVVTVEGENGATYCEFHGTVHSRAELPCHVVRRWCIDCNRWTVVTKFMRCPQGPNHTLHPNMRYEEITAESILTRYRGAFEGERYGD